MSKKTFLGKVIGMILPSLLEYSRTKLHQNLTLIKTNREKFGEITNQKKFSFHLDFVFKRFAQDRSTLMSLSTETVFDELNSFFEKEPISISIHCMGDSEDLYYCNSFFDSYNFNPRWNYTLLIPEKYYSTWSKQFGNTNISVGIWYDLGEWEYARFYKNRNYLLMTVVAGKSGQRPQQNDKNKALNIAKKHPQSYFILDGGWNVGEMPKTSNTDIVSHTSFWNSFLV